MKNLKKAVALLIAVVMVFCLSACHPKGEVAISSGDVEITSAMYSYYLVMADLEAQQYVQDNVDTTAEDFDLYKQKIEGKSYEDYVRDLALKYSLKAVAYQKLCAEHELTLKDEDKANAEYNAQYNWYYGAGQYGYGMFLPLNGVSYDTYVNITEINYFGDIYFKHLYDEGGEKEISKEDIKKAHDENYSAVYALAESYTDDATLKTAKEKLTKYVERLNKGEEFKKIYNEHNNVEEDKEETAEETDDKDAPKAKDELIVIVGSDKTESTYKFSKYSEVSAMKKDEIKLIEDTENKQVYLIVKKDINEDSYYIDELLASDILYLIKGDEFTAAIDEYVAALEYEVSKFAVNQFKIKDINYGN